jgi:hypothetical protein
MGFHSWRLRRAQSNSQPNGVAVIQVKRCAALNFWGNPPEQAVLWVILPAEGQWCILIRVHSRHSRSLPKIRAIRAIRDSLHQRIR